MLHTAQKAVHEVESELSAALVSVQARLGVRELVDRFPALGGTHYLECRLTDALPQVDFLVSVTQHQRSSLAASLAVESAAGLLGLRRFLARWAEAESVLSEHVPVIWLEFDDVLRQRSAPSANVCMCISPHYVDPFAEPQSLPRPDQLRLIEASLQGVLGPGEDFTPELAACDRFLTELPTGAHFIHLSVMHERSPIELKLYGCFPEQDLLPYLERIGWAGDLSALQRTLARYCPGRRTGGTLHVDLPLPARGSSVSSLGISFAQQQLRHAVEDQPSRRGLLEALVADGLCTPNKAEALAAWPRELSRPSGRRGVSDRSQTWFDVKLVCRSGQPELAKAYLGFVAEPAFTRPVQPELAIDPRGS